MGCAHTPPGKTLANIMAVMAPGGRLLFRDYGLYDHAMFRFKVPLAWRWRAVDPLPVLLFGSPRQEGQKLEERFYVRGDGTRAYYFTTGAARTGQRTLFAAARPFG